MSIYVSHTVNCDGAQLPQGRAEGKGERFGARESAAALVDLDSCSWWTAEGAQTPADARREARATGWVRRRHEGRLLDLCPACATTPEEQR